MNTEERFMDLWTDYLEGELGERSLAELRELMAKDKHLVELAADGLRMHRLLGMAEQENRWQQDTFVSEIMAKLPSGEEEFVGTVMHRLPCAPSGKEPREILRSGIWRLALAAAAVAVLATTIFFNLKSVPRTIAHVTALSGSVQWTTGGGLVQSDLKIGAPIRGGVLETMDHDSLVECEFLDGTRISLSGHSQATLFEHERQKILHVQEGHMFADVTPQPEDKPMIVITRTAEAEVLGTKFQVDCEAQSTSLSVKEGLVQVRRLADGSTSKVPSDYMIVAALELDTEFKAVPHRDFITSWEADVRRDIAYGELLHTSFGKPDSIRAKPLLWRGDDGRQNPFLIYVASLNTCAATPLLESDSSIRVRGMVKKDAMVVFGFTANHCKGGFAGKYSYVKKNIEASQGEGDYFEVDIPLKEFSRDMGRRNYPESPVGLELHQCWILTLHKDFGLEVLDVELHDRNKKRTK